MANKTPLPLVDWFHRDCTVEYCVWMIPTKLCQYAKDTANSVDPDRTMTPQDLTRAIAAYVYKDKAKAE